MTGFPARVQRVSRARFNIPGTKSSGETASARPSTTVEKPPVASPEVICSEPAAKCRKIAEVEAQPMPVTSAATPMRNTRPLPDGFDWSGITVCFATDLGTVSQEEAESRVLAAGGKVGAAISQRTSILVLGGNLPDGQPAIASPKYQRFLELQIKGKVHAKVLAEAVFLGMLPSAALPQPEKQMPHEQRQAPTSVSAPGGRQEQKAKSSPMRNWVDVFSPSRLEDLLGNQTAIEKLAQWLQDWDDVILRGKTKKLAFRYGNTPDNVNVMRPSFKCEPVTVCRHSRKSKFPSETRPKRRWPRA